MAVAQEYETRPVDIRAGDFELRLAETEAEVEAAQSLRYKIFYEEMAAKATPEMAASRRDFDGFDDYCDHLLIIDHRRGAGAKGVVGTYRLLRRSVAARCGKFYSADEFDISRLVAQPGEILELGRSCVGEDYRSRAAMQLLWRGIADYVLHYGISVMFGCGSLPGTDPAKLAMPLSYLYCNHLAPPELRACALPERYVDMRIVPPGQIDQRAAIGMLPALIKGYLRLGGFIGDGAVVDRQFNTTDVCIIVKTNLLAQKYYRHYIREADRPAGA
jgi:putative hemolysin